MLGQEYELLPRRLPLEGPVGAGNTDCAWSCHAVGSSAAAGRRGGDGDALEPGRDIPLRESSGLLWMWPDPSPEGETKEILVRVPLITSLLVDCTRCKQSVIPSCALLITVI